MFFKLFNKYQKLVILGGGKIKWENPEYYSIIANLSLLHKYIYSWFFIPDSSTSFCTLLLKTLILPGVDNRFIPVSFIITRIDESFFYRSKTFFFWSKTFVFTEAKLFFYWNKTFAFTEAKLFFYRSKTYLFTETKLIFYRSKTYFLPKQPFFLPKQTFFTEAMFF